MEKRLEMNWLNLETKFIRAEEYVGCEPIARATWLNVIVYCAEQENGGRIRNCEMWRDRQWQQTCGVTVEEINKATPLLHWDGDDLVVWNYPADKEREVRDRREASARGGRSKTQAKVEAAKTNGAKSNDVHLGVETQGKHDSLGGADPTEGKEKEKEKENIIGQNKSAQIKFSPPTPNEVEIYANEINYPINGQAWCDSYAQKGWKVGRNKMIDWKAAVRTWKAQSWKPNAKTTTTQIEERFNIF